MAVHLIMQDGVYVYDHVVLWKHKYLNILEMQSCFQLCDKTFSIRVLHNLYAQAAENLCASSLFSPNGLLSLFITNKRTQNLCFFFFIFHAFKQVYHSNTLQNIAEYKYKHFK